MQSGRRSLPSSEIFFKIDVDFDGGCGSALEARNLFPSPAIHAGYRTTATERELRVQQGGAFR